MNRNFSIRTLRLLAQLRDGEEINGGDIQSREMRGLMEFLLRQGAVSVIRQRSRLRYSAPNRDKFLMYLADYDHYLTNLDAAIRKAEGKTFSHGYGATARRAEKKAPKAGFPSFRRCP